MKQSIGVDFGGTNIKAGIVDIENGTILSVKSTPTLARDGHAAVLERIGDLVEQLITESGSSHTTFESIGVGVPGVVDIENGKTVFLPNLAGTWPQVPVADTLHQRIGLKVRILNDVRAITNGEWKFGAGRGANTMACFAIGTGVGGGLVINRQLHLGMGGTAGELGHQTIDPNGPRCGCGNKGCLEAFISGPAISAMGIKAVIQGLTTNIGQMVDYDLNHISPETIYRAAEAGDEVAVEILDRVGLYLGIGISNILVSIGPDRVVIAGGVASAFDHFIGSTLRTINERVFVMPHQKVQVVRAELGSQAGVLGAAVWAAEYPEPAIQ